MSAPDVKQEVCTEEYRKLQSSRKIAEFCSDGITLLENYLAKIENDKLPQLLKLPPPFGGKFFEVGPELLTVIGAPPGAGKTALAMQVAFGALKLNQGMPVVIGNAETSADALFRRQLAAITDVKSSKLRFGKLSQSEMQELRQASELLRAEISGLDFINECCLESLMNLSECQPGLLVVDYLQKFFPNPSDPKASAFQVMDVLRKLVKNHGWAVLALSATSRTGQGKDGSGHDSKKLSLASLRDSSELEYNVDAAYLLIDHGPKDKDEESVSITRSELRCVKNRNDGKKPINLLFNMPKFRFEEPPLDGYLDEFAPFASNPFGGDDAEEN